MRMVLEAVMAGMALAGTGLAAAQPYPAKPVLLIVGFAAGGGTDVLARALGQQLTESLGQTFTVDNRKLRHGHFNRRRLLDWKTSTSANHR